MENEIRYYLRNLRDLMTEPTEDEQREAFKPQYIITAVKLPTGAIEIALNNQNIASKIDYILEAYDDDMHLKANTSIVMQNLMIV